MEFPQILRKVAAALDLAPQTVLEQSRQQALVDARFILYLLLDNQNEDAPQIATYFNQHRTTVISGLKSARHLLRCNRFFKAKYEKCRLAMQE